MEESLLLLLFYWPVLKNQKYVGRTSSNVFKKQEKIFMQINSHLERKTPNLLVKALECPQGFRCVSCQLTEFLDTFVESENQSPPVGQPSPSTICREKTGPRSCSSQKAGFGCFCLIWKPDIFWQFPELNLWKAETERMDVESFRFGIPRDPQNLGKSYILSESAHGSFSGRFAMHFLRQAPDVASDFPPIRAFWRREF